MENHFPLAKGSELKKYQDNRIAFVDRIRIHKSYQNEDFYAKFNINKHEMHQNDNFYAFWLDIGNLTNCTIYRTIK